MKVTGYYQFDSDKFRDLNPIERKIFLQLVNAINDQNFDEWIARGSIGQFIFENDDLGYSISFDGTFPLKLVFNITDNRFYFRYNDKIVDVFVLKTWKDIDDWIDGKKFNIADISDDEVFRSFKKNDS